MCDIDFNVIKNECKYLKPCIEGLTCRNEYNLENRGSWGNCSRSCCPIITRKVAGAVYVEGKKIVEIETIKYS